MEVSNSKFQLKRDVGASEGSNLLISTSRGCYKKHNNVHLRLPETIDPNTDKKKKISKSDSLAKRRIIYFSVRISLSFSS